MTARHAAGRRGPVWAWSRDALKSEALAAMKAASVQRLNADRARADGAVQLAAAFDRLAELEDDAANRAARAAARPALLRVPVVRRSEDHSAQG